MGCYDDDKMDCSKRLTPEYGGEERKTINRAVLQPVPVSFVLLRFRLTPSTLLASYILTGLPSKRIWTINRERCSDSVR